MHPPSVDRLARSLSGTGLPHALLVDIARAAIERGAPESASSEASATARSLLRPVVNATGVLLHTNLGRAPLGDLRPSSMPRGASNLEFDLVTGTRGSRSAHVAALVARATGAEAALVVNNGAAALLLALAALGMGKATLVSRGELVEIGGGFRLPEIMETSGTRLIEVGTTNRTTLADYERALARADDVAAVLKVHPSNFAMVGFTASTPVQELASLRPAIALIVDAGSGLLDSNTPWLGGPPPAWLAGEPGIRQAIEAHADLVTFSGDKLLGGPQAGLIVGRRELVEACRRHPLARALRPGVHTLAMLQDLFLAYLDRRGRDIPFWRLACTPPEELRRRAEQFGVGEVVACDSAVGGGSVPGATIPSFGISLEGDHAAALRGGSTPVIARVRDGRTLLDLRTVETAEDPVVLAAIRTLHAS